MNTPVKILYVDDNLLDRELVLDALQKEHGGFEVTQAASRRDFEAALLRGAYDLVLSDFNILGFEGLQVLDMVHAADPEIPVVIVTGTGSEEIAVEALKRGAADYVIKTPKHIRRLPAAIHATIERVRGDKERIKAERERDRLFSNSIDLLSISGFDGYFKQVNPAWERTLGWTTAELLATPFIEFVHPDDREMTAANIRTLARGKLVGPTENRYRCKDGSYKWISWSSRPLPEEGLIFAVARDVTERRKTEELLLTLSKAVEASGDIIFMTDREGVITYVNAAFTRTYGYEPAEVVGKTTPRILKSGLQGAGTYEVFWETLLNKKIVAAELFNRTKDGRVLQIESSANPIMDARGHIAGFLAVQRDITARKRSEEQLRQSEASLESAQAQAQLGSWELNLATQSGYWSKEMFRLFGLEPSSEPPAFGEFLELVHPDDRAKVMESMTVARDQGLVMELEFRSNPARGPFRIFDSRFEIVRDSGGAVTALRGTVLDISNRKRMQEEIVRSEGRLRDVFNASRDVICTLSPSAVITSLSPAFQRITGWKAEEWEGKSISDIVHPDDIGRVMQYFQAVIRGTVPEIFEFRARRTDGVYVTGEVSATPLVSEGRVHGVLATIRDITDRKKLEEQLVQAQKLESLGTLASGIAHDFNNILGIIIGHSSLLDRARSDPPALSRSIDAIQNAGSRGAALVRQLLTFARKTESVFVPVRINDLVKEITKLLSETFPKTIKVRTDLGRDLPLVTGDPTQIHQVLLNLCVNARDAMSKGGTLSLTTAVVESPVVQSRFPEATGGSYVVIQAVDTGTGMDDATKRRIFEPFFTTKGVGKGTGLGLALVHSIVESHDGFIDLETAPGKGTAFRIYLPAQQESMERAVSPLNDAKEIPGGTETILLIEDEEVLVELLKAVLVSKGYTVLATQDGLQGVETFARRHREIALVISDLGLPGLGGDDAFRRMRDIDPAVKMVIASGYIDPTVKSELQDLGVRHFLHKPYLPNEVLHTIREIIDGPGKGR